MSFFRLLGRRSIELRSLAISAVTTLSVLVCGFYLLYQFNVDARTVQLVEMGRAQARLMEAVGKFDAFFLEDDAVGASRAASLSQIRESHRRYEGFGDTGEIVLAERYGDEIVFLLPTRKRDFRVPPPINVGAPGAVPMKRALAGESGVVVGIDHSGSEVLAAYEWLPFLEMGLVCKVDMKEIRAPFERAALFTALFAMALVLVGWLLTVRMITPLVGRIESAKAGLEHELRVVQSLAEEADREHEVALVGGSAAMQGLRIAIERHALTDEPLLLTGPPGAGQQAVARAVHRQSARARRPFIYFDCARLSGDETSSVFGSDTDGSEAGKAALAHRGTLYLENLQELPAESQLRLLEYLQRSGRLRTGGEAFEPDVRVVAYCPKDLDEALRTGQLESALAKELGFHRLAVPALGERRADIAQLAERILRDRARGRGQVFEGLEPDSLERIVEYGWPGNVTELRSVLERSLALAKGPWVEVREELLDNTTHLGHYRLERMLGSGGMADVWLAKHDMLARPAALKLIRKGLLALEGDMRGLLERRFEQEARVTARLRSPHTVELYDFGLSETGDFYYVMELLDGMDLGHLVRECGPLEVERAVFFLVQACRSLEEAHEQGLIHRDIKPSNLFACRLGTQHDFLKVLDFGIVKALDTSEGQPMTRTGATPGTPNYLAPEVLRGLAADPKADVYALGCVAYFLLTGGEVFRPDTTQDVYRAHLESAPAAPSGAASGPVPAELDALVLRCLSKEPAGRPTARELRQALGRLPVPEAWTDERAARWWELHAERLADPDATRPFRGGPG